MNASVGGGCGHKRWQRKEVKRCVHTVDQSERFIPIVRRVQLAGEIGGEAVQREEGRVD